MPVFEHIAAKAHTTAVVGQVSATVARDRTKDFALAFEGYVLVPADGVYDFPLQANDGARLYIDGRLVTKILNNITEGVDRTLRALGVLRLTRGYHVSGSNTQASVTVIPNWPLTKLGFFPADLYSELCYNVIRKDPEMRNHR